MFSTTWHSISQMARQDDEYRAFIVELHRRLQQANSSVRLTAGINPVLYALGLVAMALIGFSIAGLFVRALVTAEFAGALFLVGFAAWFTWRSAASCGATSRASTRSMLCRKMFCRNKRSLGRASLAARPNLTAR